MSVMAENARVLRPYGVEMGEGNIKEVFLLDS